jgi:hypothetical protein
MQTPADLEETCLLQEVHPAQKNTGEGDLLKPRSGKAEIQDCFFSAMTRDHFISDDQTAYPPCVGIY